MKLGLETSKNVLHLSFSGKKLGGYPNYIKSLLEVKEAAAQANLKAGCISPNQYESLIRAIQDLHEKIRNSSQAQLEEIFPVDVLGGGGSIGIHFNISELICMRSNLELSAVNCSQSTADVCHTASRISIIRCWSDLKRSLFSVIGILEEQSKAFEPIATLARTCLQDAISVSLGESWSAYPSMLKRRAIALEKSIESLYHINLGGTVIGSGRGASEVYRNAVVLSLSSICQLPVKLRSNLYDAAQNSDDLGIVSSELTHLALACMKIGRDLRLLSSGPRGGFGEIRLPRLQEGSSFFSEKVNPVVPETLLQCGFQVIGADRAIQSALEHADLNLNVFEGSIVINILDSMLWLTRGLQLFFQYGLKGLQAVQSRCAELSHYQHALSVKALSGEQ